ncbi:ribosome assembly RNA-binding protein YhbY [Isachenkonia alkalipeptolytica]|uniref:Ribosome assembly RNA-binding protein YhbY n=1 Tax=Isachenkonia alkalipeptolytica TaxID=2565777 RepID=A0AA43XM71_9CLOT|nr:ribosome assembly RNA-binding protein YhbY [Isachenkonia alkalipeptolytica]NBG88941.1 ribosome assembly RNA-binding protein YhbY [Isachenkonia alkalipeptolytica]
MLKGKQRSYLKKLAHDIDSIFQIGKAGINENFIEQLKNALEARELVKITVLDNSDLDTKEAASEVAEKTEAEFVQAIGKKFVIYKESEENKKIKLPKA